MSLSDGSLSPADVAAVVGIRCITNKIRGFISAVYRCGIAAKCSKPMGNWKLLIRLNS